MLVDYLPQALKDALGPDALFWIGYLTNGKHLGWYASVQYTLEAMEQSGFGPDQNAAFYGARAGWTQFLKALEETLKRMD